MLKDEELRGMLSETLFKLYDHGTLPNALREADVILEALTAAGRIIPEGAEAQTGKRYYAAGFVDPEGDTHRLSPETDDRERAERDVAKVEATARELGGFAYPVVLISTGRYPWREVQSDE